MRQRFLPRIVIAALLIMSILAVMAVPSFAQSPPTDSSNAVFPFAGARFDNGACLISIGALSDNVELLPIPGLLDMDIGPLCSVWYTDIFSTLWKDQPKRTSSISFEVAVKTSLGSPRLNGGLTLGPSFEQQESGSNISDYFTAATGAFLSYNWAKSRERPWGPWGYAKYKSGLEDGYIDGWQLGVGFYFRS